MKPCKMLLGLPLLFGFSTAFAADPPARVPAATSASSSQDPQGSHCVVQVKRVVPREKVSWTRERGCFPTFAEAIKKAIGVDVGPNATPDTITAAELRSAQGAVIGIDYDLENYSGDTVTWTVSDPRGCSGGSYKANEPIVFNDRLSSTKALNGCNQNINYEDYDQQGGAVTCNPDCNSLAFYNSDNLTSSKEWLP